MQSPSSSLPEVLLSQVASYIQDEIQPVDPMCFRAATRIQAQYRAWLVRTYGYTDLFAYPVCSRCGAADGTYMFSTDMCRPCTEYFDAVVACEWGR